MANSSPKYYSTNLLTAHPACLASVQLPAWRSQKEIRRPRTLTPAPTATSFLTPFPSKLLIDELHSSTGPKNILIPCRPRALPPFHTARASSPCPCSRPCARALARTPVRLKSTARSPASPCTNTAVYREEHTLSSRYAAPSPSVSAHYLSRSVFPIVVITWQCHWCTTIGG